MAVTRERGKQTTRWKLLSQRTALLLVIAWSVAVVFSLGWNIHHAHDRITDQAYAMANAALDKDFAYRQLVAGSGGIYIPVSDLVQPNPYLAHIPYRDMTAPDGTPLTLVNSSYFTRLVHDLEAQAGGIRGFVTSEDPLRAANRPDAWHQSALTAFRQGQTEVAGVVDLEGQAYFRLMRPREAQESCFACHAPPPDDADAVNLLGGLSVSIPLEPLQERLPEELMVLVLGHAGLWLLGLTGIRAGYQRIYAQEQHLNHNAYHDDLTGLPNRNFLLEYLEHHFKDLRRRGEHLALVLLDIDRFKNINDSLGHGTGDALLREIAERLSNQLRQQDQVFRLGGDEFVVVLHGLGGDLQQAIDRARGMTGYFQQILTEPFAVAGYTLHLTPSAGIAVFPEQGDNAETLLQHADVAMYRVKAEGRDGIAVFEPGMRSALDQRLRLEKAMRQALQSGGFSLAYQPQYDIAGHIRGFEALARWNDPELGPVSPTEFIAVAEESGLILPLGHYLLEQAAQQVQDWRETGLWPDQARIAVNVSAKEFRRKDFAAQVEYILAKTGLPYEVLDIELTESALLDDIDGGIELMQHLQAQGVWFSLDDFGQGYSSLSYLKCLPVNCLKIDKSFVHDIELANRNASLVATIIAIGHTMGIAVIAEGVETASQLEFLQERNCDCYQGFWFKRPMNATEATQYLRGYSDSSG